MDEKEFKTRVSRLAQVAAVLEKLPAEVRSDAFDLLNGYVTEHSTGSADKKTAKIKTGHIAGQTDEEFFGAFNHEKPADNARLIVASFYRQYGVEPFSVDEVRRRGTLSDTCRVRSATG